MTDTIGDVIRHDDSIIDLGAVDDEGLFYLLEETARRLTVPGWHYLRVDREEDEAAVDLIETEIYWRFRLGAGLDEDLPGAYRCALGCCEI